MSSRIEQQAGFVRLSGLFDDAWYRARYADARPELGAEDAAEHFVRAGARAGHWPNPYFDTGWYLFQNPDVAAADENPLLDYIVRGEFAGCAPSPHFDALWYRAHYAVAADALCLRHFLERRHSGAVSPLPEFDPRFYLAAYPDVATAGADPFEHFLTWGFREGRNPSATFDTRFYVHRHLGGDLARNPLLHYRQFRSVLRLPTSPPPEERAVHDEVRRFTRPGPDFESVASLPPGAPRRAKLLAYYLPQFHPIEENDAWWGEGFTEWTFLARGQPRFIGHYQPRTPRDLGHYTLDGSATLRRQIELARGAGLFGFVMYFYWFNGRRLLDRPIEDFLADEALDFPFCLMWANENWTRRWDGADSEVLISQDYRPADDTALIDCFARHFRDPRYIRIDSRPVLMVYRPRLIPRARRTIARWRKLFAKRHGESPILVMAQSFGDADPRAYGLDAAIEFPPHKLVDGLALRNAEVTPLDFGATGQVFAYEDVVCASLAAPAPPYPLIRTAVPSWDNDARREGAGIVLHGSTPSRYQAWLSALVDRAVAEPVFGESLVCINAWNEWGEGAYLEPDVHFGAAYANATARAVMAPRAQARTRRLLLVGHDAYPAGAQRLLLALGRTLQARCGLEVAFVLLGGGALLAEYESVAPTIVATSARALATAIGGEASGAAIVNTAAAASAVTEAAAAGLRVIWLIHEMPRLLAERGLWPEVARAAPDAAVAVFPARCVADPFAEAVRVERMRILPQGCYSPAPRDPARGRAMRERHGIAPGALLVLGAGTGDLRKGFDLFLQAWRAARRSGDGDVAFCWIGAIDPTLRGWLGPEIDAAIATGAFHAPGFQPDAGAWFSAADVFALTSREDPFPSVVLEAMSADLPVVAFAGSGGGADLVARTGGGAVVEMGDAEAMAAALLAAGREPAPKFSEMIRRQFEFGDYARALVHEAMPELLSISVAVTSCDYARFLPERLDSVFAQSHPVAEVVLLDDASSDDSIAVAHAVAAERRREIEIVARPARSGSPFGLWREAARTAQGEWLWIAESDDVADANMLGGLADALSAAPDAVLAACDSAAIGPGGETIWPNHQGYYAHSGAAELAGDLVLPAWSFARRFLATRNLLLNASAVLWRRSALLAALDRCGDELASWRVAGDWRLYLEVMAAEAAPVVWVAQPLNRHRRHAGSVTSRTSARTHAKEIARMHALLAERLGLGEAERARQAAYRAELEDANRKVA